MNHEYPMREAISEARKAMGRTHPNPAVGAVVVHANEVVARGNTLPAGQAHAEVVALKAFADTGITSDASTVLYVTMEPCSTTGRTPPCTSAIIESGIRHVVIGCTDPNPRHAGRGYAVLEEAGVQVEHGILSSECEDLNLIFNWRMQNDGPFFAGKIATTIDGRIATRGGLSKWITGVEAREDVHRWRSYFPAIAVGAGTIRADNPSLTIRIPGEPEACPVRMVFDRGLVTFRDELPRVYTDEWHDRTIVVTDASHAAEVGQLENKHGIRFWLISDVASRNGHDALAGKCREAGIDGVFIEGGSRLLSRFLENRCLHYLFAYRAPRILADASGLEPFMGMSPASMEEALCLREVRQATFGDDQLMRGFIVYPAVR